MKIIYICMSVQMHSPVGVPYDYSILDKLAPSPIIVGIVLVVIIAYVALFRYSRHWQPPPMPPHLAPRVGW